MIDQVSSTPPVGPGSDDANAATQFRAVWLPLLNQKQLRRFHGGVGLFLIFAALFLPGSDMRDPQTADLLQNVPAHVRYVASASNFPFALALTYTAALYVTVLAAIVGAFARLDFAPMERLYGSRRTVTRLIVPVGFAVLWACLAFFDIVPTPGRPSTVLFHLIGQYRSLLALWCVGIYFVFSAAGLTLLNEFTAFFRKEVRS